MRFVLFSLIASTTALRFVANADEIIDQSQATARPDPPVNIESPTEDDEHHDDHAHITNMPWIHQKHDIKAHHKKGSLSQNDD